MKTFEIIEIDRDYRTVTGVKRMEFFSQEAADEHCRRETWTGYRYHAKEVKE